MSRGRLLVEAIDREHRRAQALILARVASVDTEPEATEPDDRPVRPQTWLE